MRPWRPELGRATLSLQQRSLPIHAQPLSHQLQATVLLGWGKTCLLWGGVVKLCARCMLLSPLHAAVIYCMWLQWSIAAPSKSHPELQWHQHPWHGEACWYRRAGEEAAMHQCAHVKNNTES